MIGTASYMAPEMATGSDKAEGGDCPPPPQNYTGP